MENAGGPSWKRNTGGAVEGGTHLVYYLHMLWLLRSRAAMIFIITDVNSVCAIQNVCFLLLTERELINLKRKAWPDGVNY